MGKCTQIYIEPSWRYREWFHAASNEFISQQSISPIFQCLGFTQQQRIKKPTELKLLDDTKNILHTYYIRRRWFGNWSLQTYTIIVPIKFAEVVQKSVENLEKGRVHKMLIERMHHQHHVIQISFSFFFLKKYDSSRFNAELTARGPSKDTWNRWKIYRTSVSKAYVEISPWWAPRIRLS